MSEKKCTGPCGKWLEETSENFAWRHDTKKFRTQCRLCTAAKKRTWYSENKDKVAKVNQKWKDNNPEKAAEALRKAQVNQRNKRKAAAKPKVKLVLCSFAGCDKKHLAKGFCQLHYKRVLKYGDPNINKRLVGDKECSIDGCDRERKVKGYCWLHHKRIIRYGDPNVNKRQPKREECSVDNCSKKHYAKGFCKLHYERFMRCEDPNLLKRIPSSERKGNLKLCTGPCKKWLEENENNFYLIPSENKFRAQCRACEKASRKISAKKYRDKNPELSAKRRKAWRDKNPEKVIAYKPRRNALSLAKRKNDPVHRFMFNFTRRFKSGLKSNSVDKNGARTKDIYLKYFGATLPEVNAWLEEENPEGIGKQGPYDKKTWDDNDPSTWTYHVDHIIPQSKLKFDSFEDPNFKRCWHPLNLRLIPAKENIKKGNQLPNKDLSAQLYIAKQAKVFESWLSNYREQLTAKDQAAISLHNV